MKRQKSSVMARENFLNGNWETIKSLYPDLTQEEKPQGDSLQAQELIGEIGRRVWRSVGNSELYQQLGEDRFNALPETDRLGIIASNLAYIKAAKDLAQVVRKRKLVKRNKRSSA